MSLLRLLQTDLIFMSRRSKPLVWLIAAMSLLRLLQQTDLIFMSLCSKPLGCLLSP